MSQLDYFGGYLSLFSLFVFVAVSLVLQFFSAIINYLSSIALIFFSKYSLHYSSLLFLKAWKQENTLFGRKLSTFWHVEESFDPDEVIKT